jgi:transcriptional regulator with XRE-family HTH domain
MSERHRAYATKGKPGSGVMGQRIKQRRLELGMALQDFCEAVGTHASQVTGYENRGVYPQVPTLMAMAKVLGVSVDWLCGLTDVKEAGATFVTAGVWAQDGSKFMTYSRINLNGKHMYLKEGA